MDNVIGVTLITHTYTSDTIGQRVPTDIEKTVIGYKSAIGGREFNDAGLRGIQAQFKVEVWTSEYNGAQVVKVSNVVYNVYRTYENNNGKTELYLEKRV